MKSINWERCLAGAALMVSAGVLMMGGSYLVDAIRYDFPPQSPTVPGVALDTGRLPSSDCWYEVGMRDADGKPGGDKITEVETRCP